MCRVHPRTCDKIVNRCKRASPYVQRKSFLQASFRPVVLSELKTATCKSNPNRRIAINIVCDGFGKEVHSKLVFLPCVIDDAHPDIVAKRKFSLGVLLLLDCTVVHVSEMVLSTLNIA